MARKTFAQMAAERPKYDASEGFGDPEQWKDAFRERMGLEEAQRVVGGKGARAVFGLPVVCTWAEVQKAYRKRMIEVHPDRIAFSGLSLAEATQKTREANAAFAILAAEFGK